MKKFIVASLVLVVLFSCGSNDSKEEKKDDVTDVTKNPDYQKGLDIVAKSDCLGCHNVDQPITGPTYRDVANKYASMPVDSAVEYLSKKIISGGSGVWGQTPMLPHTSMPPEDAKAIAKYILLLKK